MLKDCLSKVREVAPLVHNITNYVTVNDVANIILASGASPIMADSYEEVEEITSLCGGLNINMGTLNKDTITAMLRAGKKANEIGRPVLLDPVGVGASKLRTDTALLFVKKIQFSCIRGNISEMKSLAQGYGNTKGVDADSADAITKDNIMDSVAFAKEMANRFHCVIAITGAIDLVADKDTCYVIKNGRKEMSRITGTGCQLSGLITAYLASNKGNELEAVAAAVCAMGYAGEVGYSHLQDFEGNSSYRNHIIDAVYKMTGEELQKGAKFEIL